MDKRRIIKYLDETPLTGPGGMDKIKKVLKIILENKGSGSGDVTKEELQEALAEKQDVLESGVTIKTINNTSVLGQGNIVIPKGEKGEIGDTPNFTVGNVTTGEPDTPVVVTITGTKENPVLNFTIPRGLRGEQGDTGVSADYPITIHNGLDSDATDEALAAFQGKVLDGKISQLQQKVNSLPRGKDYGFFTSSSLLPSGATEEGFAYVGATEPYVIWQFDGTSWSDSGVTANAFTANNKQVQDAVDDYLQDHPTVSGTFLNVAKRKLISLLEKVAFIDEHGQDYINELTASLFLSPIDHIDAVFTQGTWNCYDIYRLEQLKEHLVVTVYYVDGSHSIESDYILTGTLAAGTSTITASVVDGVTGDTVTDTFNVTVIGTTKLYVDGDECTAVTGGWQKKGFNLKAGTPTIAKNSDHLLFKFATWDNASATGTISTVNKIDVSGKTKCLCEIELYNETGWAGGWIYFPGTLAESTTQAGAFGSDYSSNRSMISSAPGSVTLVTGFQEPNVITTRTSDYISINFNAYQANNSGYTPGAYLKVKRIAIV